VGYDSPHEGSCAGGGSDKTGIDQNLGLPTAFIYGTMFGGGMRFDHPNLEGSGAKGPDAGAHFGEARFGPHGRFSPGETNLTATVRINLGYLEENSDDKPAITATGVDPSTGELWAGIGSALIHFSQDGNPIEIYYLTMNGVPLKPSALLIEPDRFLIAAGPWGIFEFARPR